MLADLNVCPEGVAVLPDTRRPKAIAHRLHRVGHVTGVALTDDRPPGRINPTPAQSMRVILREVRVDLPPQGHRHFKASTCTLACDQVSSCFLEASIVPAHALAALEEVLAALEVLAAQEDELPVRRHVAQALLQEALAEGWVKGAIVLDHQERPQGPLTTVASDNVLPDEQVRQSATDRSSSQVKTEELVAVWQQIPLLCQVGHKSSLGQGLYVYEPPVHRWEALRR
mmetsp:Transcript_27121/g.56283  ORF Transcript_27121/g.56283 Transcript_27121/m.56283 type:complete len:228 (-) Transcript_27121:263-946(-)